MKHSRMFTQGCTNLIILVDHKPLLGTFNDQDLNSIQKPGLQSMKENTLGKEHRGPDACLNTKAVILVVLSTQTKNIYSTLSEKPSPHVMNTLMNNKRSTLK